MHKSKKLSTFSLIALLPLFLAACGQQVKNGVVKAPTDPFNGTLYKFIGLPLQHLMEWIAGIVNNASGYGIAIIVITLLVRLILLPLMIRQQRTMTVSQEKQKVLQPQLQIVTAATKRAKTPEQQMEMNTYMRRIYSENGTKMIPSMGCLTLLIQLPIFSGLYSAIAYSPKIANATFFGVPLGHSSLLIAILATIPYILQSLVMIQGAPAEQRKAMQATAIFSPAMTFFFCLMYNAGLGLYFGAGGIILLIQQLIVTYIVTPNIRKKLDTEMAENPPVVVVDEHTFDYLDQPTSTTPNAAQQTPNASPSNDPKNPDLRKRNAGKQQRPHK